MSSSLSPIVERYLAALPPGRHIGPAVLSGLAHIVCAAEDHWRPIVRHDPVERWYTCLHRDGAVEVWLLGWDGGQDTRIHDHGGGSGAFVVAEGTLTELHTTLGRRGPLRQRRHRRGRPVAFGPSYVHDLGNRGPQRATSVHVYAPPLRTMTYYDLRAGTLVPTERVPVAGPEVPVP